MSKALVQFFLCILGMLASFNFSEIRIFFWKDLPVLRGGGRLLASVSYCAGWRITSRAYKAEVLISLIFQFFNSVSSQMNGFFPHVKVVYGRRAFQMFALSWPTSLADVKCERPSIRNLFL
jgi:hypothetical protein